ncbi:MAG: formylglycine-generating enzyme family protein [Planctomycetaceae bacterium]|nr:formylglycine-generating enzyme family protein [Planctomycetaceae bacterium]
MTRTCRPLEITLASLGLLLFSADTLLPAAGQPKKDPGKTMTAAERQELLKTFNAEFVEITPGKGKFPGTFVMGTKGGDASEQPARQVTMSGSFAMARYEVPQNLWEAVMGKNPSRWTGPRNSVEMLSWQEATVFCRKATVLMRQSGLLDGNEEIRLPSEAEWEFCCRAGTTTAYSFGEKARSANDKGNKASLADPYAWHTGNAAGNDPPIGAKKPNAWGLYDMHGYLWEFVADAWHPNYVGAPVDGSAWKADEKYVSRIIRSGSWRDRHPSLRSAVRVSIPDHAKSDAIGLRCVKATTGPTSKK